MLDRLRHESFDLVVIGGGASGAGVLLDAASRGLKTALIEKGDFASGTSSKSSKMIHGGLRYIPQHEFRLVYENLSERQRLLDNAPHLVSPLPFLIPLFGSAGLGSRIIGRAYSTTLWIYDLTGGMRIGTHHQRVSATQAVEHFPSLNRANLSGGFIYMDAQADDARLTLSIVRTAALNYNAVAANYVNLQGFLFDDKERIVGVKAASSIPGSEEEADKSCFGRHRDSFEIKAKVVVNATGVWADDVRSLDEAKHPESLRPAKGVHITVPYSRLECDIAAVIAVHDDKRSIFVVPWPDSDLVYIGTTDTSYHDSLEDPKCLSEDIEYLLNAVNSVSSAKLNRDDITGVWAGLRPLLAPNKKSKRVSERTADLSRRHSVKRSEHGLITLTGGKLTTYRQMAEETVDIVQDQLYATKDLGPGSTPDSTPAPLRGRTNCRTKELKLYGAPEHNSDLDQDAASDTAGLGVTVSGELRKHLFHRYGTESTKVLELVSCDPLLLLPLVDGLEYIRAEVVFAVRNEMAQTISDVLDRRTRARLLRARASAKAARTVGEIMAQELGWSDTQTHSRVRAFIDGVSQELMDAGLKPLEIEGLDEGQT